MEQELTPGPQRAAYELGLHSMFAALAFVVIVGVAVLLEAFARLLLWLHVVEPNSMLAWAIRIGEYSLLSIDILLLIGVVAKLSVKLYKTL